MRTLLAAAACLAIAACQQPAANDSARADAEAERTGDDGAGFAPQWIHAGDAATATLMNQETPNATAFTLTCAKAAGGAAGGTLEMLAGMDQPGAQNIAPPFAMVASGTPFAATLKASEPGALIFQVTAPVTPALLTALNGSKTLRIHVKDGDAFAESGIDPGPEFERFTAACAALTGIKPG